MRKLASIQIVNTVEPIPNADAIEKFYEKEWYSGPWRRNTTRTSGAVSASRRPTRGFCSSMTSDLSAAL